MRQWVLTNKIATEKNKVAVKDYYKIINTHQREITNFSSPKQLLEIIHIKRTLIRSIDWKLL